MATFLELVNDVARESGTISQSQELATVVGAQGRLRKIVNWTRQAWEMIQRSRTDWTFQRLQHEGTLTIGQTAYSGNDLGAPSFKQWLRNLEPLPQFTLYDPDLGRADEARLYPLMFPEWAQRWDIGVHEQQRPGWYAIGPDNLLRVAGPPDKPYKLRFWYRRGIQSLTADDDVPIIDEDLHQVIVWRALILLGEDDEAAMEITTSASDFREAFNAMVLQYTPPISLARGFE